MPRNAVLASLLLAAALGACRASPRTIVLAPGMDVSVAVDPAGVPAITVRVPEGSENAGTYTSSSPHLVDEVRAIQETLGQPGVRAWMQVDDTNEILSVTHEVTLQ